MEEKVLKEIAEPLAELDIKVTKVMYVKEEGVSYLRIMIDKEPYVDVDTCVEATKVINPIIDRLDLTIENYVLDVCSTEKGDL